MKAELKQKWLADLRSGQYSQGKETLRVRMPEGDFHCCLGVLRETAGLEWKECEIVPGRTEFRSPVHAGGYLNGEECQRLGIESDLAVQVARMNDSGKDFNQIADWIEANIPVES